MKRINIILAMFAVALLMVFSINVFSQEKQTQPEESTDKEMMKECLSHMDSDMMSMCSKMMANMKEGSSMCSMMNDKTDKDNTDKKEIEGDQPEKESSSDESEKQREVPEIKG